MPSYENSCSPSSKNLGVIQIFLLKYNLAFNNNYYYQQVNSSRYHYFQRFALVALAEVH